MSAQERRAGSARWRGLGREASWLLPPALLGLLLRTYRLPPQVLSGDEVHSLGGALERPIPEILSTWTHDGGADYCVPLTALLRLWLELGIPVDETWLRAPVWLAGVATGLLLPLWLAPRVGRPTAAVWAWLLAVSPMLVLYGRIARSYAPLVLLTLAAVLAFERWWRTREGWAAGAYVGCAALAVWFHLGAATLVAAPFVYAAGSLAWAGRRQSARDWLRLAGVGAAAAAVTALLLWPARESLRALSSIQGRGHLPEAATWLEVLQLEVGIANAPVAGLLAAFALAGLVVLARRRPRLTACLVVVAVTHGVGLAVLAPNYLQDAVVASRYLLPILPIGLLGLAAAIVAATEWIASRAGTGDAATRERTALAVGVAVSVLLLVAGPLARPEFRRGSFVHARSFLHFTRAGVQMAEAQVPAFYRAVPAPGGLIEFPWFNLASQAFAAYQRHHDRPVRVSVARPEVFEGASLRTVLQPEPERWRTSGARYLVLHRDVQREEGRLRGTGPGHERLLSRVPQFWQTLRREARRMERTLQTEWGPPVYSDDDIAVWDLTVAGLYVDGAGP